MKNAAIGGGSLLLLGLIDRTTKDLDLVAIVKDRELRSANPLPRPLVQAAEEVGRALDLGKDWLNIGPASLFEMGLPPGFIGRLHIRQYKGLTLYLADRFDLIKSALNYMPVWIKDLKASILDCAH